MQENPKPKENEMKKNVTITETNLVGTALRAVRTVHGALGERALPNPCKDRRGGPYDHNPD